MQGANNQGIKEHIKVKKKQDAFGVGAVSSSTLQCHWPGRPSHVGSVHSAAACVYDQAQQRKLDLLGWSAAARLAVRPLAASGCCQVQCCWCPCLWASYFNSQQPQKRCTTCIKFSILTATLWLLPLPPL